jgi:hypothetical protein
MHRPLLCRAEPLCPSPRHGRVELPPAPIPVAEPPKACSPRPQGNFPSRPILCPSRNLAGAGSTAARLGRRRRATPPVLPPRQPKVEIGPRAPLDHPTPVPGRPRRRTSPEFHHPRRPPPPGATLQGERTFRGLNRKIRAQL